MNGRQPRPPGQLLAGPTTILETGPGSNKQATYLPHGVPTFAIVPSHLALVVSTGRARETHPYYTVIPAQKKKGQDPDFASPLNYARPPTTARLRTSSHQPDDTVPLGPASFFPSCRRSEVGHCPRQPTHARKGKESDAERLIWLVRDGTGCEGRRESWRRRALESAGKKSGEARSEYT